MIKVSAGLRRKVGEANYSSRYGSAGVGTISVRQIALGGIFLGLMVFGEKSQGNGKGVTGTRNAGKGSRLSQMN